MDSARQRFRRLLVHLQRGTLPLRIKVLWQRYLKQRRLEWWDRRRAGGGRLVFPLRRGVNVYLYFDSVLSRLVYCDRFEWRELQFLEAYLKPGDVFVDVGANIGLYSLVASRIVGNKGWVFAFEPCAKTSQRLAENLELNGLKNVRCYQAALSDRSCRMPLHASLDGYDAWNSLVNPTQGRAFAVEMVDTIVWDEFAPRHGLTGAVRLMKIDAEGWESHILAGGEVTFRRQDAPVLQVEFTEQACLAAGSSCQALYRQLEGLGYQLFLYDAQTRRLVPDALRQSYPYLNLVAAKDPCAIESRIGAHPSC